MKHLEKDLLSTSVRNASQRELEFLHKEYSVKHYTVVMFIPLERRNNKYPEVTLKALESCCTIGARLGSHS